MRIETIGDATLYLADCHSVVPTLGKVDAVLTDPPYGIDYGRAGGFSALHGWGPWRENVTWDKERPGREIFDMMRDCSREQIIWGGNYFTDYLPPTMQWLIWDKGQRDFSLADAEMAWSSQNKATRILTLPRAVARLDGKEHPTQKPLGLMQWCLGFLPDAETILDCFAGVGTTGVACAHLSRRFIGIELDPGHFETACRRIEQAYRQPRLFAEPAPKPQQMALVP